MMDMKLGIALGRFRKPSLGALPVVLNQPTTLQVTEVSGGRKLTWTNNSEYHTGTYVYRAPTLDPQALPAPVATVDPVAQGETAEWVDNATLSPGDYDYAVQDFDGQGVGALSAMGAYTAPVTIDSASIGDEVEGGIYAGIDTIDGIAYYIVVGKSESHADSLQWKTSNTWTSDTQSDSDGLANTIAIDTAGLAAHPSAAHCLAYEGGGHTDWHMPARNQLNLIHNNISGHPELSTIVNSGVPVWSSTTDSTDYARAKNLSTGSFGNWYKTGTKWAVPIRRVPV